MPCLVCGKEHVNVYSKIAPIDGGEPEIRAYCQPCFISTFGEDDPMVIEIRAMQKENREKQINEKIARDLQQLRTHFRPKLEELIAKNPRFSFESYEFIYASLTRAVHDMEPDPQTRGRHANAAELVRACQEQARHAWGDDARAHAKSLGFSSAADIRDIVFYLVENGSLGRRANDNRADFDGLSFLNSPSP
jgi:uncharacterized repeat protein (TIGR04138 family)